MNRLPQVSTQKPTKADVLEQIKELTDRISIVGEQTRQEIIDYVDALYDQLQPEQEAFGFTAEDVRKKHLEMVIDAIRHKDQDLRNHLMDQLESGLLTPANAQENGLPVLTAEQCEHVLDKIMDDADLTIGVSWDNVEWALEEVVFTESGEVAQ